MRLDEGPRDGVRVLVARVADQNRLDGSAGVEGAALELDQGLAVGVGALGEDEHLEVVRLADGRGGGWAIGCAVRCGVGGGAVAVYLVE